LNLILAIFWFVLGIGSFGLSLRAEDPQSPAVQQQRLMAGLSGLLAFYNLVRWWLARLREKARLDLEALKEQRRRLSTPPVVDPAFDFSDPPPEGEKK
jgi:hypothetical protein